MECFWETISGCVAALMDSITHQGTEGRRRRRRKKEEGVIGDAAFDIDQGKLTTPGLCNKGLERIVARRWH